MQRDEFDEIEVREIAVEACADPRTVRKLLDGGTVRGIVGDRIRRVLDRRRQLRAAPATK